VVIVKHRQIEFLSLYKDIRYGPKTTCYPGNLELIYFYVEKTIAAGVLYVS
jgi:hypothetical protein